MEKELNLGILSTLEGFNSAVRFIKKTNAFIDGLEKNANPGDLLFEMEDGELLRDEAALLLRMILIDKLKYAAFSFNPPSPAPEPASLAEEFKKWKAVDMLAAYHHPVRGLLTANPKVPEELAAFGVPGKRELMTVYAGKSSLARGDEICIKAAETAAALFSAEKPRIPQELYAGPFEPRPFGRPQKIAGPPRMTPLYSVAVQNELFHNGNVEAWKRIIASYTAKYPELRVHIYYEGERILDINSLFKWGKVKHGNSIQFAIAGRDIRDAAKLRRYLIQGAGRQFEPFLHGPPGAALKLF
ncbi:MAG: hypothetical protein LBU18_07205 [Treponema sp.]|jgi:hypothetical protein|nr:hypothetical protein [Treponema sp.]